ncbi:DMT family transporter [uncultured Enterovirga sp.]|uniref:DMT family transporter n=1 Tax=uncultured Enterovirga sp. TaxID=2026352 RepID=UPI0035CA8FB9
MKMTGRVTDWLGGQPYLLLGGAALGWAGNTIASRLAIGRVSPMAIVSLRWLVVVLVLAVVVRGPLRTEWRRLLPHWRYILAMGTLGFTIFNAIFYWSAHHTTAVNMGVLQGVTPAIVMAIGFAAYRTPVGMMQAIGLLVTLVGVTVAASHGDLEILRHLAFNVGDIGIALASVLYAGYTVGLRGRPAVSPLVFFAAMAVAAFLSSLPLLAAEMTFGTIIWPTVGGWLLILYIALVPSLLCQLLYMRGVELIGPSRAGLFMNLVPILGPILAIVVLGETFAPYHAAALLFVLGGLWLAEQRRPA